MYREAVWVCANRDCHDIPEIFYNRQQTCEKCGGTLFKKMIVKDGEPMLPPKPIRPVRPEEENE